MAARPTAPLKVQKDSHVIQKPSSSSSAQQQRCLQPVIIYARPAQVIHTTVEDFKAVVHKYTSRPQSAAKQCSSSSSSSSSSAPPQPSTPTSSPTTGFDVSSSSSVSSFREQGTIGGGNGDGNGMTTKSAAAAAAPILRPLSPLGNSFLSDETRIANLLASNESFDFLGPWGTPTDPSAAGAETFDSIWTSTYWAQ